MFSLTLFHFILFYFILFYFTDQKLTLTKELNYENTGFRNFNISITPRNNKCPSKTYWLYVKVHFKERKEGNVLFNDALNTFYLRLYGVRHMVKNHSDSERGNPLPSHGLLFPIISQQGFFYMHHPTDRVAHTTAFITPVVEHWLEREIAQWVHSLKDRSDDPSHHERTLLPRSYISLLVLFCFACV